MHNTILFRGTTGKSFTQKPLLVYLLIFVGFSSNFVLSFPLFQIQKGFKNSVASEFRTIDALDIP